MKPEVILGIISLIEQEVPNAVALIVAWKASGLSVEDYCADASTRNASATAAAEAEIKSQGGA